MTELKIKLVILEEKIDPIEDIFAMGTIYHAKCFINNVMFRFPSGISNQTKSTVERRCLKYLERAGFKDVEVCHEKF